MSRAVHGLPKGTKVAYLVKRSTMTRMESTPVTFGRPDVKSSETESHGPVGTGSGSRRPAGERRSVFWSWQDLHVRTNCSTSERRAGQVK